MPMTYSNVMEDTIFPSFIYSCIPDVDLKELKKESYDISENYRSNQKTNINGYQSPTFTNDEINGQSEFKKLYECVKSFSQDFAKKKNLGLKLNRIGWWVNINKEYDYNLAHHHGNCDLIAVYYVKLPENSGDLVLLRKDGMEYTNLYRNVCHGNLNFKISSDVGRLYLLPSCLWHYVQANQSNEDRISVSFNIYLDQ